MDDIATTGAHVWARLVTVMRPESWDSDIEAAICEELKLKRDLPLGDALDASVIDADRFVRAFFTVATPYVAMWDELLSLMQRANATRGSGALRVDYHFGNGQDPDVSFDLDHFRKAREILARGMARFDLRGVGHDVLWNIVQVVRRGCPNPPDDLRWWLDPNRTDAPWPDSLPPMPPPVDPAFVALAEELRDLAEFVLAETRAVSGSREDLRSRTDELATAPGGTPVSLLAYAENDGWVGSLLSAVLAASLAAPDPSRVTAVDAELARYRNRDASLTSAQRLLEDFLDLPLWQHRHELFSNWVCTRVVDALADQEPRVHAADGALVFRFGGTHLATFDMTTPRLHLFTELRTAHAKPVGKRRKGAIQPDISLVRDPITEREASPLVVECKQYLRADHRGFAEALTDYARGRPKATVVLVDNGPVGEDAVLDLVPPEVRERTFVVGSLRPGNDAALARFAALVRASLPEVAATDLGVAGRITLTWRPPPADLDLHVTVVTSDEPREIYYSDRGDLESAPWCALDRDSLDGAEAETVTIARWLRGARYEVSVVRYSQGTLADAAPVVSIETADGTTRHTCPPGVTDVWQVTTIVEPVN